MTQPDLSIIIPSRNEKFLQGTVDDLLRKATGEIEVIVVLDGYWPDPPLAEDKRVTVVHFSESRGTRVAINVGVRIASGKFVMKCDAHCMFAPGFDEVLKADCGRDWIVIPTRYSLDVSSGEDSLGWRKFKYPINYHYFAFPYGEASGLFAIHWREKHEPRLAARESIMVDDLMTFQASCWFTRRDYFNRVLGPMDDANYGSHQEDVELSLKCWLSGGRVVVNKNTWYAHLHKGWTHMRGYPMYKSARQRCEKFSVDYWMNDRWPLAKHKFQWLVDKFWPLPGWPDDWEDVHRKMGNPE
jgi:glycosyltransferase involved in cell wall biosynthesis